MNIETINILYNSRTRSGFSQKKPTDKTGISGHIISKWERSGSFPDMDSLLSMYKIYR
jgi:transcriptional regulator with XRE-family HTH domain